MTQNRVLGTRERRARGTCTARGQPPAPGIYTGHAFPATSPQGHRPQGTLDAELSRQLVKQCTPETHTKCTDQGRGSGTGRRAMPRCVGGGAEHEAHMSPTDDIPAASDHSYGPWVLTLIIKNKVQKSAPRLRSPRKHNDGPDAGKQGPPGEQVISPKHWVCTSFLVLDK